VTYASITLAVLDPDAALSLIQVEGEITRYSKKSLQLTDQDSQATIRMMQNSKLFPKSMLKGSHVRVLGFLRYESAGPAIYIPDFEHIEVLSSPQVSTIPTTTPSERIIEGAVSDTSFNQWYVVFAVPLVLLAGFAVKKYIVPRMG
jgi:hypothetical protein